MNASDPILLTQKLIRCKSVTPYDDGVMEVGEEFLKALGFQTHIMEAGPADWRVKNLYASFGHGTPNLAVIGHLDVVPAGDLSLWAHDPFAADIDNGRLIGRGSIDMKSGFACAAVAAKSLIDKGFSGTLTFIITGDEEEGTEYGTRSLLQWCWSKNIKFDACLVAEPTGFDYLGQALSIGHRGSINIELTSNGVQGHVACPEKANNPLTPLVNYLSYLTQKHWDNGEGMFPPTNLEVTSFDVGNPVSNLIPSLARAKFNIRYNKNYTEESIVDNLETTRDIFFKNPSDLSISVIEVSEPFISEDKNLISIMESAITYILGTTPAISTGGGTTDGRFIFNHCPVIEFGMPSNEMHKANELASIEDIIKLTKVYEEFYKKFFQQYLG